MKQTIWYGSTPQGVTFAKSKNQLEQSSQLSGNIGSFTVDGEITGLDYVDNTQSSQSSTQHA